MEKNIYSEENVRAIGTKVGKHRTLSVRWAPELERWTGSKLQRYSQLGLNDAQQGGTTEKE